MRIGSKREQSPAGVWSCEKGTVAVLFGLALIPVALAAGISIDYARALTARNFRWRRNGPMELYFREKLLGDYFADAFDGEQDGLFLLSGSLSVDGVRQMRQRLEEVVKEFDALLVRDATLSAKERIGVSLVLAQKPWLLQLFQGYRRALDAKG